jgi:hypothetical protein
MVPYAICLGFLALCFLNAAASFLTMLVTRKLWPAIAGGTIFLFASFAVTLYEGLTGAPDPPPVAVPLMIPDIWLTGELVSSDQPTAFFWFVIAVSLYVLWAVLLWAAIYLLIDYQRRHPAN